MLKSIILENWKTHQNTKVSFEKGTNIIVGKIGAGKSSIVDAICYSLFGTFPSLQNRKITLAETIMFKPVKRKEAKLKLEFEHDSKNYRVEREIFIGKVNTAKLFCEDKLLVGPKQTDVNERVSNILGIDYDLFVKIVYSEQNEIDYFLKIPPSKRKEQFDALFGINNLEKIKINSRSLKAYLDAEYGAIQKLIAQLENQLLSFNISDTEKNIQENQEKIKHLLESTNNLKSREQDLKSKVEILKKQKTEFDTLNQEIRAIDYRKQELSKELSVLETQKTNFFSLTRDVLLEKKQDLQKQLKESQELETKLKSIASQNFILTNQLEQINSSLDVSLDLSKINLEKEKLSQEINSAIQKQAILNSQKQENLKAVAELEKGFSKCPVCDSQLSEIQIFEKLKSKKETNAKITNDILALDKSLLSLREEFSLLQKKERKASEQHLLVDRKQRIIEEKKKLDEQEKALGKPKDISALEKEIDAIIQAIDYQTKKEQLSEIIKKQEFFSKKLLSMNYDDNNYLSLLADLRNQEEKLNNNNVQISLIQGIIKNLENTKAQYEKLSLNLKENQNTITKLETKQKDMVFFSQALENSQEHLRKVLVDNINKTLEVIWPKVYPYGDYLSARLKAENDYVLEVLTLGKEWIRVEGLLSGGERTCAALSIRVAIALSLTKNLGLLILDEPTHNMDSKTISMLSSILDKELPELVEQIFIITHDQKLLETTNSSKYIIERDKENDGVSFIKEE